MPARRTEPALTVSLFPFLAVLVCAMGALILLLLIITRQVRSASVQKAAQTSDKALVSTEDRFLCSPKIQSAQIQTPQSTAPIKVARLKEPVSTDLNARKYNQSKDGDQKQIDLINAQKDALAKSIAEKNSIQTQIHTLAMRLDKETKKDLDLQAHYAKLTQQKNKLDQLQANHHVMPEQTDTEMKQLQGLLLSKTQELNRQKKIASDLIGKLEIVTYDGPTGIRRKPIFIECLADKIVFQPEQVEISYRKLKAFSPDHHPLALAVRALANYRNIKTNSHQPPYVLLVVRPQGVNEFYFSRRILGIQNITFGYELVEQGQKLYFSEHDPQAKRILEDAIAQARSSSKSNLADGFYLAGSGNNRHRMNRSAPSRTFGNKPANKTNQPFSFPGIEKSNSFNKEQQRTASGRAGHNSTSRSAGQRTSKYRRNSSNDSDSVERDSLRRSQLTKSSLAQRGWENPKSADSNSSSRVGKSDTLQLKEIIAQGGPMGNPRQYPQLHSLSSRAKQLRQRSPDTLIGIERKITVLIAPGHMKIGKQNSESISANDPEIVTQRTFLNLLEREMSHWDQPPKGFRWLPAFRLTVAPGGNQIAFRIEAVAKELSLSSETNFTIGQGSTQKVFN